MRMSRYECGMCLVVYLLVQVGGPKSISVIFFFQAEDGIRDLVRSRGLGDVYKRQTTSWDCCTRSQNSTGSGGRSPSRSVSPRVFFNRGISCLLYTSDAADERSSVDLGGRRIIKKKKRENIE